MRRIRNLTLVLAIVSAIAGCAAPQTRGVSVSDSAAKQEAALQMELAAQDIVAEQTRLQRVYRQLSTKAYALCGERIGPNIGTVSLIKPKGDMGDALTRLYGIKEQPTVVLTFDRGPAEKAGLKPRDVLLSVNGVSTSDKPAMEALVEKLSPDDPIVYAVDRAGVAMTFTVQPERGCRYFVALSPDQTINAFADGTRIMVTRGMMNFAKDDNELALVISHELAHNTMKHSDAKKQNMGLGLLADLAVIILTRGQAGNPNFAQIGGAAYSQEFEAEADYVGLYIMAEAGLPIADAPKFWRRMAAAHPANIKTNHSASHPSTSHRMVALEETVKEINEKIAKKVALIPNMKDDNPSPPVVASATGVTKAVADISKHREEPQKPIGDAIATKLVSTDKAVEDPALQKSLQHEQEKRQTQPISPSPSIKQVQLPPCPGSYNAATWNNCVGDVTWPSGDKYVGAFKDGKRNGQGTYAFSNGQKYVGEFNDGNMNGQGTYTFPTGQKFVGEFSNGKGNGQGTEYRADGTILRSGVWANGVFVSGR